MSSGDGGASRQSMTSNRPYLMRAIHQWIVDNGLTPHIIANSEAPGMAIPVQYAQDGKIVLNIAPSAVRNLELGNEWVSFNARFGGKPWQVVIPVNAVMAVYAKENGVGMAFQDDEPDGGPPDTPDDKKPARPNLRVIK